MKKNHALMSARRMVAMWKAAKVRTDKTPTIYCVVVRRDGRTLVDECYRTHKAATRRIAAVRRDVKRDLERELARKKGKR